MTASSDERPLSPALKRGLALRCPACGKGPLLHSYLKVAESCPACGEDFTAQRADDGPAYLTILVVGHLMAPLLLWVFMAWRPSPWVLIGVFMTGCVLLSLLLLPRFKGMLVAIQWAKRMHGFSGTPDQPEPAP